MFVDIVDFIFECDKHKINFPPVHIPEIAQLDIKPLGVLGVDTATFCVLCVYTIYLPREIQNAIGRIVAKKLNINKKGVLCLRK